jgi:pimeloyl-ACP methyl ester carboxylesterase
MFRTVRRAAALAFILLAAPAFAAAPSLHVEPYAFRLADGTDLPAEKGSFTVPEDRNDPRSRRIDIGFVRFKSTNPRPGAPIVYLAGGPGGSGVATARGPRQPIFLALRQVADVIILDQRGIGLSNHIPSCTAERKFDPSQVLNEANLTSYYRETLAACVTRWRSAGVAVKGYTTVQNAEDLEDLRRALGAPRIDLWAISYGTHLAMAMIRLHPRSVGRVALASSEGMDQTVKLPAHVDAAFARIDAASGKPLTALMRRVHARYDSAPQTFTMPDGTSFRIDSFPLRMMAGFVAKNPDGIPQLLQAYGALDAGQTGPIAPLIWGYFYKDPLTMSGMPELTDEASGISPARLALVRRQAASSLSGMAINFPMPQIGGVVPGLDLGDAFRREIKSSHQTLLFEGDLDVRTPLEEQAAATAGFRNLHRILVRNGGHDLFEAHPDVKDLLVAFFAGGPVTARELVLPPLGGATR